MKNLFHLFTYVCLVLVLLACKREDEEEVLPETPETTTVQWELDSRFGSGFTEQYSSYADETSLYFLGRESFSRMLTNVNEDVFHHIPLEVTNNRFLHMPINADIFVTVSGSRVRFTPTADPERETAAFELPIGEVTSSGFSHFEERSAIPAIILNSKNECFIPYHTYSTEFGFDYEVMKVTLSVERSEDGTQVDTLSTQIISEGYFLTWHLLNDDVYVIGDGMWKLTESGDLNVSSSEIHSIFQVDG
ncbi:MAG: hypothetical protein AAF734_05860, partial [Bacteroidota bacterium]